MIGASLRVLFDRTGTMPHDMRERASQVVRKTALDLQADWASGVRVDTGNLRNSIGSNAHPEHIHEENGDLNVTVGTGVEYAVFENFGTHKMSGSFAREKAVERRRGPFNDAMRQAKQP